MSSTDRAAVGTAVASVCEQSFFAYAEPATSAVLDAAQGFAQWYEVEVGFSGAFGGRFCIALPVPLAHELFSSFIGCDDDDVQPAEAIEDAIGEFTNMACGAWLTALGEHEVFSLEKPAVRITADPCVIGGAVFAVNDQPLLVGVSLGAEAVWAQVE